MVKGMRGAGGVSGAVKASWRRTGRTGRWTPAIAPIRCRPGARGADDRGAGDPAAVGVDGGDPVAGGVEAGDGGVRGEDDARPGGGARVALDRQSGPGVAVGRGVGGGHQPVGADVGAQLRVPRAGPIMRLGTPRLFWIRTPVSKSAACCSLVSRKR